MSGSHPQLLILGPASRSGGALNYIRNAVPRIAGQWDGRVLIALPRTVCQLLPEELRHPATLVPLDRPAWARGPLHVLPSTLKARRILREFQPDVVLTLGNFAYSGPRRPTLVVLNNAARLRDLRWPNLSSVAYIAGQRLLYWLIAIRATRALAVSEHLKGILPRPLQGDRTVVAHHGVLTPRVPAPNPSNRARRGIRILLPGSIVPYRGIERVLDGLRGHDSDDLEIRIAGLDGQKSYRRRINRHAERCGLEGRLQWLGHLTQEQLWQEMTEATHVIISSRVEACPNSLLEAAAIDPARPILGFLDAWSEEFAPLFDARVERHQLAEMLLATAHGSSAATIAERERTLQRLSWERCIATTVSALWETAGMRAE